MDCWYSLGSHMIFWSDLFGFGLKHWMKIIIINRKLSVMYMVKSNCVLHNYVNPATDWPWVLRVSVLPLPIIKKLWHWLYSHEVVVLVKPSLFLLIFNLIWFNLNLWMVFFLRPGVFWGSVQLVCLWVSLFCKARK